MSKALIRIQPGLMALLHGGTSELSPFLRELLVLECHIAGTSYLDLEETEPVLIVNDRFLLVREPENKFDEFAVAIYTPGKVKLGYLPRDKNETIARLLDAGKMIFVTMIEKQWMGDWLKMTVRAFLVDK